MCVCVCVEKETEREREREREREERERERERERVRIILNDTFSYICKYCSEGGLAAKSAKLQYRSEFEL